MKSITLEQQSKVFICLRYFIYFVLTAGFALLMRPFSAIYLDKTFVEFGLVENLQIALLMVTALVFMVQAALLKESRSLLVFLASLCCFAVIRELDHYFELLIPFISWKFAIIFPLGAFCYLIRDRKQAKQSIASFIGTPAFSLMVMMMFIFIAVAQVIGNKAFISNSISKLEDVALIRRFIEESVELIGYFVLLLSSVEFYFSMKRQKKTED